MLETVPEHRPSAMDLLRTPFLQGALQREARKQELTFTRQPTQRLTKDAPRT